MQIRLTVTRTQGSRQTSADVLVTAEPGATLSSVAQQLRTAAGVSAPGRLFAGLDPLEDDAPLGRPSAGGRRAPVAGRPRHTGDADRESRPICSVRARTPEGSTFSPLRMTATWRGSSRSGSGAARTRTSAWTTPTSPVSMAELLVRHEHELHAGVRARPRLHERHDAGRRAGRRRSGGDAAGFSVASGGILYSAVRRSRRRAGPPSASRWQPAMWRSAASAGAAARPIRRRCASTCRRVRRRRAAPRSAVSAMEQYERDRAEADRRIAGALTTEARIRREAAPDPATLLVSAVRPDARLWERRPGEPDFLRLRLGTAALPSNVTVVGGKAVQPRVPTVPVTVDLASVRRRRPGGSAAGAGAAGALRRWRRWPARTARSTWRS